MTARPGLKIRALTAEISRPTLSTALFPLDPFNLQLQWFLGLSALYCCSFFCAFDLPTSAAKNGIFNRNF